LFLSSEPVGVDEVLARKHQDDIENGHSIDYTLMEGVVDDIFETDKRLYSILDNEKKLPGVAESNEEDNMSDKSLEP